MPLAPEGVVSEEARRLVSQERSALSRLRELLAGHQANDGDLQVLRQAELDLDELFLLVVVGEFNAGKSAFVNALLGERVLAEGVTPTTAAITRVRYSPSVTQHRAGPLVEIGFPLDLLRDVAIVDTPGTNAILREHEEVTRHFVPRADLVLFVTSADRPFTETERAFMERIRDWGKKVVVVLNKADLLADETDLRDQTEFVREGVQRLLGFSPLVFPVSARQALAARAGTDRAEAEAALVRSGFDRLERFVEETLDEAGRLQLKLLTPLGVAERTSRTYVLAGEEKLSVLSEDIALVEGVERQLGLYREDMRRDFQLRLGQIDNILHEMSARGLEYLDQTLRVSNVVDLFRQKRVREEFERVVVADAPQRIDRSAQELIDWMVDQDLRVWRTITEQVERRRRASASDGPAERLAGSFEYDRRALLRSLGGTARDVIQRHNHEREADQLAQSVKGAVTQATLIEVGALGLGAVSLAIVGSAAADVTGLFAAGVLAGLGLWVLPRKRRQAKQQFAERTEQLRQRLVTAMRDEFERELERSIQRIRDALAPYDRFVRAEHARTTHFLRELRGVLDELERLRAAVGTLRPGLETRVPAQG